MAHYLWVGLGAALLTIALCFVGYTGWIFVSASAFWLSQILGAALIVLAFLLAALCLCLIWTAAK